jgi:ATP-dependent RNA helicase DeaD
VRRRSCSTPRPSPTGRPARSERPERRPRSGDSPFATYRIAVGKRQKVEPRQIVGAIANEGGLSRQDFGHIDIRPDHSLVELPADLPSDAWSKLKGTRISGRLIELAPDSGRPPQRKKPRTKSR